MSNLASAVETLRKLLTAEPGYSNATVIWEPKKSDASFEFKRDIIAKAEQILMTGEAALADRHPKTTEFGDADFNAVEQALVNDAEQQAYYELALACEHVIRLIRQTAI